MNELDDKSQQAQGGLLKALESPAQKLPPEVLGIIFQYACPLPEFSQPLETLQSFNQTSARRSRQHFSFATVSSTWRHAVYATPQLWTSVVLSHDDTQLLELYVTESRFLHLALELRYPLSRLTTQPLQGGYILSKVAFKLKSLIVMNLEDDTLDYLSTLEFPVLESISVLCKGYRILSRLEVTKAPILQHFSLRTLPHFDISPFELPWLSITSLRLEHVPLIICLQCITHCYNLIDFRCHKVYRTRDRVLYRIPLTLVTLPYLKLFHWFPCNMIQEAFLRPFQYFRMPGLQSLGLGWLNGRVEPLWNIFFQELPQTLQKLQFYSFHNRWYGDILYPECLLEHTPHLQELILDQCSRLFINDVLAVLSSYDSFTGDPIYLPDLRILVIINFFPPLDVDIPDAAREMVEKRFAGRNELPTFSISTETRGDSALGESENARMTLVIDD